MQLVTKGLDEYILVEFRVFELRVGEQQKKKKFRQENDWDQVIPFVLCRRCEI